MTPAPATAIVGQNMRESRGSALDGERRAGDRDDEDGERRRPELCARENHKC